MREWCFRAELVTHRAWSTAAVHPDPQIADAGQRNTHCGRKREDWFRPRPKRHPAHALTVLWTYNIRRLRFIMKSTRPYGVILWSEGSISALDAHFCRARMSDICSRLYPTVKAALRHRSVDWQTETHRRSRSEEPKVRTTAPLSHWFIEIYTFLPHKNKCFGKS